MKTKGIRFSLLLEFYGQLLSERQCQLVDYYYNDELSLAEISELTGITRQGVRDGINKAESILETYENKLRMYELYSKRESFGGEAVDLLSKLSEKYKIDPLDAEYIRLKNVIETLQQ